MADEATSTAVAQDNVQVAEPVVEDQNKSPSPEDAKQDDIMTGRLWRRLRAENQAFKANFDEVCLSFLPEEKKVKMNHVLV